MKPTIGIFGFGSFGRFLAENLAESFEIAVTDVKNCATEIGFDHRMKDKVRWGTPEQTAANDIVIFAVPFRDLETLLQNVSAMISSSTTVMDVCSVKIEPLRLMEKYLPHADGIIATHPLFGRQSAATGLAGHRIAVCNPHVETWAWHSLRKFLLDEWKLQIVETDAQTHDISMAKVQAITHFICRALNQMFPSKFGMERDYFGLGTTSFERIRSAAELLHEDSWQLFETIQNGNPYAKEIRQGFVQELLELERRLEEK